MAPEPASETTPLLGSNGPVHGSSQNSDGHGHHHAGLAPDELPPTTRSIPRRRRILVLVMIFTLAILTIFGSAMVITAMYELLEDVICDQVHGPGTHLRYGRQADDSPCKEGRVVGQVAKLVGWLSSAMSLPGLLAVPYGVMADRYGRTLVMGLAAVGVLTMQLWITAVCRWPDVFPVQTVLVGAAFLAIGGGPMAFNSMIYAIATDISTETQRSTVFFFVGATFSGSTSFALGVVYLLMKRDAWLTIYLGLTLNTLTVVLAFCVPETLDKKTAVETDPVIMVSTDGGEPKTALQRLLHKAGLAISYTGDTARWIFIEHKLVGWLLVSLSCEMLGGFVNLIEPFYLSTRYHMPYGDSSLVLAVETSVLMVLLTFILPISSRVLTATLGWTPREKDLRLAQLSAVLSATGVFIISLAGKLWIYIIGTIIGKLGGGYTFMVRGLMSSLVGGHNIGLLYSCMAFFETLSFLVSGPLFGALLHVGTGWGGNWVGLPYLVSGGILLVAMCMIGFIRTSVIHDGEPAIWGERVSTAGGVQQERGR